jgi:hypothetical protein
MLNVVAQVQARHASAGGAERLKISQCLSPLQAATVRSSPASAAPLKHRPIFVE